eukprot:scaffold258082_cov13-Tisochrysis_lutea.AAC.1
MDIWWLLVNSQGEARGVFEGYMLRPVEDLHDENTVLRKRAGLGPAEAVDLQGVRMQKQATIAQLRSLNALLERQ